MKASKTVSMKNGFGLVPLRTRIGRAWLPVIFLLATTAVVKAEDYAYTTNPDNTVTITKYNGSGGDVVIPSAIDGKTVTSIGFQAFWTCYSLTSGTIPDSVTSIGSEAFGACINLAGIRIGDSVTNIGEMAFTICENLNYVNIPDSVTSIGYRAFGQCGLTSVKIGKGVTSIGDRAFSSCLRLTEVRFRGDAPSIGSNVFSAVRATVYYLAGTTGWGTKFGGCPTAVWKP